MEGFKSVNGLMVPGDSKADLMDLNRLDKGMDYDNCERNYEELCGF